MHLFEFMDLPWAPKSLRDTLRDILECGNSRPFRTYYDWICDAVVGVAANCQCDVVIELGAGTAPVSRRLLCKPEADSLTLVVADDNPDVELYRQMEESSAGRVAPIYEPVDFSQPREWPENSLLVLSATLHHVPSSKRREIIQMLRSSNCPVLIFEPLRNNMLSVLFTLLSLFPAVCTPFRYLNRPGRLRRFFWCLLIPVAPLMFCWDGFASCIRQWTESEWRDNLLRLQEPSKGFVIQHTLFCQRVYLSLPVSCVSAHEHVEEAALSF
jgi:hypothetical protein